MTMEERRRLLMGAEKTGLLPPDFQQVAYLDKRATSDNKPYIDTRFVFTGKVCEFLWRGGGFETTTGNPFGTSKSTDGRFHLYIVNHSTTCRIRCGSYDTSVAALTNLSRNVGITIGLICNETEEENKLFTLWNYTENIPWKDTYGNMRVDIGYTGTCKIGKSNYLFASNGGTTHPSFRYEYAAFREDGEMKREYIPCYRKVDRKPGMYDLVTREFYTNVGTGEFELGPDV